MVKTKLKPLLPSLREKKRYLAFELISKGKISDCNVVSKAIMDSSLQLLGLLGAAKAGVIVLNNKWNSTMQRGIIKVTHKYVDALKAALMLTNNLNDKDVIFKSVCVSGILNKAEKNSH